MIEIQATGDTTLHTAGKYCPEDILVKVPAGSSSAGESNITPCTITFSCDESMASIGDILYTSIVDGQIALISQSSVGGNDDTTSISLADIAPETILCCSASTTNGSNATFSQTETTGKIYLLNQIVDGNYVTVFFEVYGSGTCQFIFEV